MSVFSSGAIVTLTAGQALAFGTVGDGVATMGRSQGYIGTAATSTVVVRATTYTPQGNNVQRSVKSTSASDTAAGVGAQTVIINYLDASFVSHSETVTLNGTTAVNTVGTNIAFLESMQVATVGTSATNVGIIEIFTATAGGGSIWGSIAAGDNQTYWAHHYVPTGVTCYVINVTTGSTLVAGYTNIEHQQNPLATNLPTLQIGVTIVHGGSGTWDHNYQIPLAVAGPDMVLLTERPITNGTNSVFAGFEYIQF